MVLDQYHKKDWNCWNLQFKYMNFMYSFYHKHIPYIHYLKAYHGPTSRPAPVGLIAQPVKQCTGIAEVRVHVPYWTEIFRPFSHFYSSSAHRCKKHCMYTEIVVSHCSKTCILFNNNLLIKLLMLVYWRILAAEIIEFNVSLPMKHWRQCNDSGASLLWAWSVKRIQISQ